MIPGAQLVSSHPWVPDSVTTTSLVAINVSLSWFPFLESGNYSAFWQVLKTVSYIRMKNIQDTWTDLWLEGVQCQEAAHVTSSEAIQRRVGGVSVERATSRDGIDYSSCCCRSAVLFVNLWNNYTVFVLYCLKYPLKAEYRTLVPAGSVLFHLAKVDWFLFFFWPGLLRSLKWMWLSFLFIYHFIHIVNNRHVLRTWDGFCNSVFRGRRVWDELGMLYHLSFLFSSVWTDS